MILHGTERQPRLEMLPNALSIHWRMIGLITLIVCCSPLRVPAQSQYVGGIGRGTVQTGFVPSDCAGVMGGAALPGTAGCDDGDVCTINDLYTSSCGCAGTFEDSDADGTCDAEDGCPNDPDKIDPGACGCGVPDDPFIWYADLDDDDLGDPDDPQQGYTCIQPLDHVADNTDPCPTLQDTVPGDPCSSDNPCTGAGTIDENCSCVSNSAPTDDIPIVGNWLLADGLSYSYSTLFVAGAVYEWSIQPDNGWVLNPQGSTVTVIAPPINDQVQLIVTAVSGSECAVYASMDLFVMDVGVQETFGTGPSFTVRPNPSEGQFELVCNGSVTCAFQFDVEDAVGRSVLVSGTKRAAKTLIDVGSASPGIYMLRVRHEHGTDVIRLVVC